MTICWSRRSRSTVCAVSTSDTAGFDASRAYDLHPQLALRPEKFGALAYHYGNRRLTFLKSRQLTAIVESLGDHPSIDAALQAHGVEQGRREKCDQHEFEDQGHQRTIAYTLNCVSIFRNRNQ